MIWSVQTWSTQGGTQVCSHPSPAAASRQGAIQSWPVAAGLCCGLTRFEGSSLIVLTVNLQYPHPLGGVGLPGRALKVGVPNNVGWQARCSGTRQGAVEPVDGAMRRQMMHARLKAGVVFEANGYHGTWSWCVKQLERVADRLSTVTLARVVVAWPKACEAATHSSREPCRTKKVTRIVPRPCLRLRAGSHGRFGARRCIGIIASVEPLTGASASSEHCAVRTRPQVFEVCSKWKIDKLCALCR